ncbi:golgi-body localization protein domain-containing protein [Mycena sp. CBHHK59/15]|nr:golgi-body localization protein domain-containing protein [Mycena sp. CBHHK59/15]
MAETLPSRVRDLVLYSLRFLLLGPPDHVWWTTFSAWLIRLIALSLLLRTYIAPWIVARLSRHLRLRSVSLRSIRGLYMRVGAHTLRADRISYTWSSKDGSRRLTFQVDGLTMEIGQPAKRPVERHSRALTFADFAPSPMAHRLWMLFSDMYSFLDPYLRPLFRHAFAACLRLIIRWVPGLSQVVSLDLHSPTITFTDIPGAKIVANTVGVSSVLDFTQTEKPDENGQPLRVPPQSRTSYSMAAWRRRLTLSVQRSWDRAWGQTHGSATVKLIFHDLVGSMDPSTNKSGKSAVFFTLPGVIDLTASLGFRPKRGSVDAHSIDTSLVMSDVHIELHAMIALMDSLKRSQQPDHSDAPAPLPTSPSSPQFNNSTQLPTLPSPNTPSVMFFSPPTSPTSPTSPRSPFFSAFSTSISRRHHHPPCVKLKDVQDTSTLAFLAGISISVSKITATARPESGSRDETYKFTVHDISAHARMSNPDRDALHRRWLGRGQNIDKLDPDGCIFRFATGEMKVDRTTPISQMRLVAVQSTDVQALTIQWPNHWLHSSPFIGGDPNAPLLAIHIVLGAINVTERLDRLNRMLNHLPQSDKSPQSTQPPVVPVHSYPTPRFAVEATCGAICGRLIVGAKPVDPSALEFRTDGLIASVISRFSAPERAEKPEYTNELPLHLHAEVAVVLHPTFLRVCSKRYGPNEASADDPVLLSMEAVELTGRLKGDASIGEDGNIAFVDLPSLVLQLQCASDALCVEMWHPLVIDSLTRVLSALPAKLESPPSDPSSSIIDKLPTGVVFTIALARCVVFITAPEINPDDAMDLSRGVAVRATALSVEYCSLRTFPYHRKKVWWRSQSRHKLYLSEERVLPAVSAARTSLETSTSAFIGIALSDLTFRNAVSTQYDADDPLIAERDDPNLKAQEFFHSTHIHALISLSGGTHGPGVKDTDNCEVSVVVPYVHGTLQLAHMYSTLLAVSTLKQLAQARPSHPKSRSSARTRGLLLQCNATINTIQVFCALSNQSVVLRFDAVTVLFVTREPATVQWNKGLVCVQVPVASNNCPTETPEDRWEELGRLQAWRVTLPATSDSITIEGDSARVRIPHGYVLADLILDVSVTVKAVRHLARICALGQYYAMPTPEPEGAKKVPDLTIRIGCLSAETADDPLESKLGVIWRAGLEAAKSRKVREEAFAAKVDRILAEESFSVMRDAQSADYTFNAVHSVSIQEARDRLDEVHAVDWVQRHGAARQTQLKAEEQFVRKLLGSLTKEALGAVPNLVQVTPTPTTPPLFRAVLTGLELRIAPPSFSMQHLPDFLYEQGSGLPRDTKYSLLVPMHLELSLSSLRVTLRDYPLPLISIPGKDSTVFVFAMNTDLVIAEEMGTDLSVDWVDCLVVPSDCGLRGAAPLSLSVPKTIMPVKSYANPIINISTIEATTFSWGVSYGPATQDLMRVVETLSSPPRDASPGMGFWDKMRLIFHWSIRANFAGEVRYQMKGSRDPYKVSGSGAGFVLAWQGNPKLLIARENTDKELIQVISDSMLIAIPDFSSLIPKAKRKRRQHAQAGNARPFQKICAKFRSGVRFGIGFVMERSCGTECSTCSGSPFHRKCRLFIFRPHYDVKLQKKPHIPVIKSSEDSYNNFRSDFIHLSTSLTSALTAESSRPLDSNSLHLTPQAFTHFWSWWALFDGGLTLPIRQGTAWPVRPISPKFGRHLATLKYRISVQNLYIMHAYIDDSRETWVDGVTPWIGVKCIIEEFQVDMHQREEETIVPGRRPGTTKVIRRKPFCAVELVIKGLDLRAMLATFEEPLKQRVEMASPPQRNNYRTLTDLPPTPLDSAWHDDDDFMETDWTPPSTPSLHFLPVVTCPRFTYFRRITPSRSQDDCSKFGSEGSHICLLGKEPSVPRVQINLAMARVSELKESIWRRKSDMEKPNALDDLRTMEKMLVLLEDYITLLQQTEDGSRPMGDSNGHSYHIPADTLSEAEWAEFDNVYQIHCPKIFLDSAIRDIMMQYYYCSRARRGTEYHMATRAVKFILDQAEDVSVMVSRERHRSLGTAQAAAQALKKLLSGHERKSVDEEPAHEPPIAMDPLEGWFEGVSLQKGHCCLLLKPQIVLRDENASDQTCVVAAVQAKLQSYAIMDDSNADDPVSGKVMSRTFTTLSGLQTFSPASVDYSGDGCVPLEVLIDFRCESNDFERLVPQTDATFHYDKFNRLRLRNNVTSVVKSAPEKPGLGNHNHLHDQTDLIQVNIPQFTVTANDQHFQTISNIVAKLLLFSDAAHKTRMNKLETLLFSYDFNDLASVANVVVDLQERLRDAIETESEAETGHLTIIDGKVELLKLRAHKMFLAEELSGLFECIKLAQDQRENQSEPKSALLLHTSSSEISWRMLDDQREMLSKLVVQNIDFFWLSRQDSSTVNNLTVGNLQAFDGSRDAQWAEILSKYDEPANHPLLKRGLFVLANWSVLAPVGGITIYESFQLNFHPMRLQVDAKVGRRIMEYVWPARRNRKRLTEDEANTSLDTSPDPLVLSRSSLDSPRALQMPKGRLFSAPPSLAPPIKLSASRSFTDLRTASLQVPSAPTLHRTVSSGALRPFPSSPEPSIAEGFKKKSRSDSTKLALVPKRRGDAAEMKTRSSQKSFVLVQISSLDLLLSIMKEESFVCRDAHIRTRDLEYRNQTWSFEELVDQFIPSDMSWKGWLKMAFHQPLVPVLPVARELISKTKWIANKGTGQTDMQPAPPKMSRTKAISAAGDVDGEGVASTRTPSPHRGWRKPRRRDTPPPVVVLGTPFTNEPEEGSRPPSRNRMFSLFERRSKMSHSNSGLTTSDPKSSI